MIRNDDNSAFFDAQSALDTIRALDFIRVCGSEGERRGMEVVAKRLDEIGVGWRYHIIRDKWLEPDEPRLLVRGRKLAIRPTLELSFLHGINFTTNIGPRVEIQAMLAPITDCGGKIAVLDLFDPRMAIEQGAAAQLMAFPFDPEMEAFLWAVQEEGQLVPAAIVAPADVFFVRSAFGELATMRWSVKIVEREFRNLIAEIPGKEKPTEIIAMCAHMDSFPGTVGASDDAAGCAVLIEAAKWFASHPPARTVRLLWFSGEEVDARGSRAYVSECVDDPRTVKLMVNVDSGCELHTGPFTAYASDESTLEWARRHLNFDGMEYFITKGGGTDARAFIASGIPTFAIEAPSKQSAHLPDDRPENIDLEKLQVLGSLSLSAAINAACE